MRGVRVHVFCAGLGVMLTKSLKSKFWDGVFGPPNTERRFVPPLGVVIIDDGSGEDFGGGVDGGCILDRVVTAGEGEVARYNRRSAPSSDLPAFFSLLRRPRLDLLRTGGGVLGGDDRISKECVGNRPSSSSEFAS